MYQDRRTLRGLGEFPLAPVPKPTITVTPTVPTPTATTAAAKPTVWDTINKVLNAGQQASTIYQTVKPASNVTYTTTTVVPDPSAGSNQGNESKSNLPLIIGIVAGTGLLATGIYFAVRKKPQAKS